MIFVLGVMSVSQDKLLLCRDSIYRPGSDFYQEVVTQGENVVEFEMSNVLLVVGSSEFAVDKHVRHVTIGRRIFGWHVLIDKKVQSSSYLPLGRVRAWP